MKYAVVLLFAFVISVLSAIAGEASPTLPEILEQQRGIRSALDAGTLEGLTPRQVNAIRRAQTQVFSLTDGKPDLDAMSLDDKARLSNALEQINAEMKQTRLAQDEKQVCWRERKTGSTTKVTRCGTQGERDLLRESARTYLETPRICPDCGE
jgi:hypothetical protein